MRLVSSRSMARRCAVVAVGALAVGGLATLPSLSASASSGSPAVVAQVASSVDSVANPAAKKTTKKKTTKKSTKKSSCKNKKKCTKTTKSSTTKTTKTTDTTTTTTTKTSTTKTSGGTTGPAETTHLDNPYVGAKGYVNSEWAAKATANGGSKIANQSTFVWIDRIAAIEGAENSQSNGPMGIADHLDEALQQANGQPMTVQLVVYDLPGRDCAALASNGELKADELEKYKSDYIDPYAAIITDKKYASLRIVLVIEPDSLPNLQTNKNIANCATMISNGNYEKGVQYALDKLKPASSVNIYTYLDAGHHGWLGWKESNMTPAAAKYASVVKGTARGWDSLDGIAVNVANYSALSEPFLNPVTKTLGNGGMPLRSDTKWLDWNDFADELTYAQGFRSALVSNGAPSGLGMLIDTSRNGWGGAGRPTAASTSTDVSTYVAESRIDRRIHAGNWCNQSGAGIGERPTVAPATGIDAYVWVKPPGESDGNSEPVQNTEGKGFDRMCDPTYPGNELNKNNKTGALSGAPLAGAFFAEQFKMLLANAYPPIS